MNSFYFLCAVLSGIAFISFAVRFIRSRPVKPSPFGHLKRDQYFVSALWFLLSTVMFAISAATSMRWYDVTTIAGLPLFLAALMFAKARKVGLDR